MGDIPAVLCVLMCLAGIVMKYGPAIKSGWVEWHTRAVAFIFISCITAYQMQPSKQVGLEIWDVMGHLVIDVGFIAVLILALTEVLSEMQKKSSWDAVVVWHLTGALIVLMQIMALIEKYSGVVL